MKKLYQPPIPTLTADPLWSHVGKVHSICTSYRKSWILCLHCNFYISQQSLYQLSYLTKNKLWQTLNCLLNRRKILYGRKYRYVVTINFSHTFNNASFIYSNTYMFLLKTRKFIIAQFLQLLNSQAVFSVPCSSMYDYSRFVEVY